MPDDLTPDAFARLSALEQSQELLRLAQFLNDATRRWHAETLDWHQTQLDDHAQHMARLDQLAAHAQQTLDAVLEMLRHRHGGHTP